MTIPRRRCPRPVPHEPSHRRTWRSLWRRCSCGLPAPCVDRLVPAPQLPFPPNRASPTDGRSAVGDGTDPPMSTSARIPAQRASPIRPARPDHDTARISRISPSAYLEASRAADAPGPAWPIADRADPASGRHRARAHADRTACARGPAPPHGGTATKAHPGSSGHRRSTGVTPPHIPTGPSGFIRASGTATPPEVAGPGGHLGAPGPRDRPGPTGHGRARGPRDRPGSTGHAQTHGPRDRPRPTWPTPAHETRDRPGPTSHTQTHGPRDGPGPRTARNGPGVEHCGSERVQANDTTAAGATARARAPAWDAPTVLLSQVGRAGDLTPAQAYRARQGRRW
jgi:hypothetical protein